MGLRAGNRRRKHMSHASIEPRVRPDGSLLAGVSPETGKALYVMPHDLPGTYSWDQAKKAAKDIAFGGRTDWRLPTKGELEQLYRVRDILGPFNWDFYWSSTENTPDFAWYQSFRNGFQSYVNAPYVDLAVRCVRG